jgi:hypothetical protein
MRQNLKNSGLSTILSFTKLMLIQKIVSGGQTGVDRAALDVAMELGIPCGGWCPRNRIAEDGRIAERYPLKESATSDPSVRTELNVIDSDGTLVLTWGKPTGGTLLTILCARHHHKPSLVVNLQEHPEIESLCKWSHSQEIHILNIAGPRESHDPGTIYVQAKKFLTNLLHSCRTHEQLEI